MSQKAFIFLYLLFTLKSERVRKAINGFSSSKCFSILCMASHVPLPPVLVALQNVCQSVLETVYWLWYWETCNLCFLTFFLLYFPFQINPTNGNHFKSGNLSRELEKNSSNPRLLWYDVNEIFWYADTSISHWPGKWNCLVMSIFKSQKLLKCFQR